MSTGQEFAISLLSPNLTMQAVQQHVEAALLRRLQHHIVVTHKKDGAPTHEALREQAAFMAGAGSALQAVFGGGENALTPYFSATWVFSILRGELIVEVKK